MIDQMGRVGWNVKVKGDVYEILDSYVNVGLIMCQLQRLVKECEQVTSQFVELSQGELNGSIVGEDGIHLLLN